MGKYNLRKNCCVIPQFVHIEVTEKCDVGCLQCYCDLHRGRNMEWGLFEEIIQEVSEYEIEKVMLTGGEPFYYPNLVSGVRLIKELGMKVVISSSGCGLQEEYARELMAAGMDEFYISLNGSTRSIHNASRGHFEEGIQAVKLIKKLDGWCGINWVARKDNLFDLPNMITLAKELNADCFHVISPKENFQGDKEELSLEDIKFIAETVMNDRKKGFIGIDLCFQELNYYIEKEELHEIYRKCVAGRMFFDIMADGTFCPCRHYSGGKEEREAIREYWTESALLEEIRSEIRPCGTCRKNLMDML